jgi:hypothetical protein
MMEMSMVAEGYYATKSAYKPKIMVKDSYYRCCSMKYYMKVMLKLSFKKTYR